jgi:hypothetical protein
MFAMFDDDVVTKVFRVGVAGCTKTGDKSGKELDRRWGGIE